MFVFLKCWEMCENHSLHLLNPVWWECSVRILLSACFFKSQVQERGDLDVCMCMEVAVVGERRGGTGGRAGGAHVLEWPPIPTRLGTVCMLSSLCGDWIWQMWTY